MGKAAGVARRRKKAGNHSYAKSKKLKRQRNRILKKSNNIGNELIRQAWDKSKTLKINMQRMGLCSNPNKLLREPTFFEKYSHEKEKAIGINQRVPTEFEEVDLNTFNLGKSNGENDIVGHLHQRLTVKKAKMVRRKQAKNGFKVTDENGETIESEPTLVDKLEKQASAPPAKAFRFGPDTMGFCAYMKHKYGDDYEAMARDRENVYQDSPGQIRAKIKKFFKCPNNVKVYQLAMEMSKQKSEGMDEWYFFFSHVTIVYFQVWPLQ